MGKRRTATHSRFNENLSALTATFRRMMPVLNWQSWSALCKIELIYTFIEVLQRMWQWSKNLTPEYLQPLCASPQFFEQKHQGF